MPEAYPRLSPEHECQTCGARYYSEEAASGCPCNPDGQPATVADGGVVISPSADGTHNGQPVATDGGAVTQDSAIYHYECQNDDCGEEFDLPETDYCPFCGCVEFEAVRAATDGGSAEVTDGDGQCPLCDEVGEEQRSGVGPTGNIGTLYECTNEDCKAGTYLHGRRP